MPQTPVDHGFTLTIDPDEYPWEWYLREIEEMGKANE